MRCMAQQEAIAVVTTPNHSTPPHIHLSAILSQTVSGLATTVLQQATAQQALSYSIAAPLTSCYSAQARNNQEASSMTH